LSESEQRYATVVPVYTARITSCLLPGLSTILIGFEWTNIYPAWPQPTTYCYWSLVFVCRFVRLFISKRGKRLSWTREAPKVLM